MILDTLTTAGYVALTTFVLLIGGTTAGILSRFSDLKERVTRLETMVDAHLRYHNGKRSRGGQDDG